MSLISDLLPPEAVYNPPQRGRLAPVGLQGATTSNTLGGGLPSRISSYGSPGDRLEVDLPNPITPNQARGEGNTYSPHPYLPTAQHLDYLHKFTSTSLLSIGLVLLLFMLFRHPRTATSLLARGGLKQAGIA